MRSSWTTLPSDTGKWRRSARLARSLSPQRPPTEIAAQSTSSALTEERGDHVTLGSRSAELKDVVLRRARIGSGSLTTR